MQQHQERSRPRSRCGSGRARSGRCRPPRPRAARRGRRRPGPAGAARPRTARTAWRPSACRTGCRAGSAPASARPGGRGGTAPGRTNASDAGGQLEPRAARPRPRTPTRATKKTPSSMASDGQADLEQPRSRRRTVAPHDRRYRGGPARSGRRSIGASTLVDAVSPARRYRAGPAPRRRLGPCSNRRRPWPRRSGPARRSGSACRRPAPALLLGRGPARRRGGAAAVGADARPVPAGRSRLPEPQATIGALVLGAIAGLVLAGLVDAESLTVRLIRTEVVLTPARAPRRTVPRGRGRGGLPRRRPAGAARPHRARTGPRAVPPVGRSGWRRPSLGRGSPGPTRTRTRTRTAAGSRICPEVPAEANAVFAARQQALEARRRRRHRASCARSWPGSASWCATEHKRQYWLPRCGYGR